MHYWIIAGVGPPLEQSPCWFPWDGLTSGIFTLVRFLFLVCLVIECISKNADMAAWKGVSFSQSELDQIIGWLQEFQEMPILFSDEYLGSQGPTGRLAHKTWS